MTNPNQKFHRGDVCVVVNDAWIWSSKGDHIGRGDKGELVLIDGSYTDLHGGSEERPSYAVYYCKNGSWMAWQPESHLRFVRHEGEDGIRRVLAEKAAREVHETDLAWIVTNWPTVHANMSGATAGYLMARVGIDNPWGVHGEGMAWHANYKQMRAAIDETFTRQNLAECERLLNETRLVPFDVRWGG